MLEIFPFQKNYTTGVALVDTLHLRLQLLPEEGLECLTILCKLLDTLVELVECHLVLQKSPAELWLVVNISDLWKLVGRCNFCSKGIREQGF